MSQTETLQAELSAERVAFTETLAAGGDTTPHRQRIAALEEQITKAEQVTRAAAIEQKQAETAAVEQAATKLASRTRSDVDAATNVADLAELTGEALPSVLEDPAIASAAREVARCSASLERAGVELKPYQEQATKLSARLAQKQASVDAIKRRRLAGDERDGDGAELALLAADAEALLPLVADARTKVAAADTRPAARAALANAEAALAGQQRLTTLAVAKARAELAEHVFLDAATKARAAEKAVGAVHPAFCYSVSGDLRKLVVGVR